MKIRRPSKGLVACALVAVLCGCDIAAYVQQRLQTSVDKLWSDPAKKAQTETEADTKLKASLDKQLDGKEFEVPGPNPYVHNVKSVSVDLGTKSPKIAITAQPTITQTGTNYYVTFPFSVDWAKGNGAKIDIPLDLRSHHWYLFGGYPDHTVHITDISANGDGTALAIIPASVVTAATAGKLPSSVTSSVTLAHANVDLHAGAQGWFWTVDVTKQVKGQIQDKLVHDIVGKAINLSFTP
jgi:hypothetical protein